MGWLGTVIELIKGAAPTLGKLTTFVSIIAALTPLSLFIVYNKDEVFHAITYGELAFWGSLIALQLVIAWRLRP